MTPRNFDFSACLDLLCRDLAVRVPVLGHLDADTILFTLSRSRAKGTHGLYARIAPLRFDAGTLESNRRRGRYLETWRMPQLTHKGRDILYIVTLLVPRFFRLSFQEKLRTIVHELYHVSEECNGDIRRFPGRNFAHGSSRRSYNRTIAALVDAYLDQGPPEELLDFLRFSEEEWQKSEVGVSSLRIAVPKARLVTRRKA